MLQDEWIVSISARNYGAIANGKGPITLYLLQFPWCYLALVDAVWEVICDTSANGW